MFSFCGLYHKAFSILKVGNSINDTWYLDANANQQMTFSVNEVQGIKPYIGNNSIMVNNGVGLTIYGIGIAIDSSIALQLKNVLIVPILKKKMLSVSQFTQGYQCHVSFYP